jgi:hypothetical protein
MYLFSSLGKPNKVPVGAVFGFEPTAKYMNKVFAMMERAPRNLSIPFIGKETDVTRRFSDALDRMDCGISAYHAGTADIGDSPVCVMFRYLSDDQAIDKALETTDSPILLVPPEAKSVQTQGHTINSVNGGYRPDAALVLDPLNAALYTATLVGLFNQRVRGAVIRTKKKR